MVFLVAFLKALRYIKKEKDTLKNVFLYTFYMAGDWELTDRIIELEYPNKPSITAEIYPNNNEGRILLCTAHPEYMIWRNGRITEIKKNEFHLSRYWSLSMGRYRTFKPGRKR